MPSCVCAVMGGTELGTLVLEDEVLQHGSGGCPVQPGPSLPSQACFHAYPDPAPECWLSLTIQ